jgi:hypothetical protein
VNIDKAVFFLKSSFRLLNPDSEEDALSVRIEFEDDHPVEVSIHDFNDEVPIRCEAETVGQAMAMIVTEVRKQLQDRYGGAAELIQKADDLLSEPIP